MSGAAKAQPAGVTPELATKILGLCKSMNEAGHAPPWSNATLNAYARHRLHTASKWVELSFAEGARLVEMLTHEFDAMRAARDAEMSLARPGAREALRKAAGER